MTRAVREAYVGVGSNQAPAANIAAGLAALERQFGAVITSAVYESAPLEGAGPAYWNLVAGFRTALNWSQLRAQLKSIEDKCGRRRGAAAGGVVTLDLDLLLMTDGTTSEHDLEPGELSATAHVLRPLAELLPDWVHPQAGRTLAELWADAAATAAPLVPVAALEPRGADALGPA